MIFTPLGRRGEARPDETIFDVARRTMAPIGNACGGIGVCARCRVKVLGGADALSPRTTIEARVGLQRGLDADERLACQAVVNGDCEITTTYW